MGASGDMMKVSSTTAGGPVEQSSGCCGADALPVLNLLLGGAMWLLVGAVLQALAALKLQFPEWWSHCPVFLHGRLAPAASNAILFGGLSQLGLGVGFWILKTLNQRPLAGPVLLLVGVKFWNVAVLLGVGGILLGESTGQPGLEMPRYAALMLLGAYLCVGAWGVLSLGCGRDGRFFASHTHLFGAFFWFPWLYATALVLTVLVPARGVLQAVVAAWFQGGLVWGWLVPLALAAAYYFVPALSGKPLYRPGIAAPGFWLLALAAGWAGTSTLVGGPVPAWVISAGIAARVLLILPILMVAGNLLPVLVANPGLAWSSRPLRFIAVGIVAGVLVTVGNGINAFRSIAVMHQGTLNEWARVHLLTSGFLSMILVGALYAVVPRVMQRDWPLKPLVTLHFWLAFAGVVLGFLPSAIAGHHQGVAMNAASVPWDSVVATTLSALGWRSLGMMLGLAGHGLLVVNLAVAMVRACRDCRPAVAAWICTPAEARS